MENQPNNSNTVSLRIGDHIVIDVVHDHLQINNNDYQVVGGNVKSNTVSLRIGHLIVIAVVPDHLQINNNDYQVVRGMLKLKSIKSVRDMSGRIKNVLKVYVSSHGPILTAVFSVQGPIRSEISASLLIISGVISVAVIIVLLHIFFQQFSLMRAERGLRISLVENWTWIVQRAAFVLMLMGFSIALFFAYSSMLFYRFP